MEDRPLRDDEYPDLDDERPPRQPQDLDAVSQAVGSGAFVHGYTLQECVERFAGTVARYPERFDRFYFAAEGGPLLVDILIGDQDQWDAQRVSKRTEFKRQWCQEHERRYVALTEDEADNPARVKEILAELQVTVGEKPEPRVSRPASSGQRRRGQVQRPKAEAAQ